MRSLRIRQGFREAGASLSGAWLLVRAHPWASLALGTALAVLPQALRGLLHSAGMTALLNGWERWAAGAATESTLSSLINASLQSGGNLAFASTMADLLVSLALTPLLLSALALCFNGYTRAKGIDEAFESVGLAGRGVRNLLTVSLLCMLAAWVVQMVPSFASGLLSAVAGILSFVPVLNVVAGILAIALSMLISLLTDFAVTVVFAYVWICAACEGIPGFGALVRSWQHTRNAAHQTVSSMLALALLRWLLVAALGLLWLLAGRHAGVPLRALVIASYVVGGLHTVAVGATTSALYQARPSPWGAGTRPPNEPIDFAHMKRANLDDETKG